MEQGHVHDPQEIAPPTRELVELIAERMDVGVGRWRLEFEFDDGVLARWFRREGPAPAGAIRRFDPPPAEPG